MLTPVKAIRAKCLDCCGGSAHEVEQCSVERCSLFPYRFGKNPNIKLSPEEKARRQAVGRENHRRLRAFQETKAAEGKNTTPDISAGTA